jgi:hypothetical protein
MLGSGLLRNIMMAAGQIMYGKVIRMSYIWLEDAENDLQELQMKRQRQKANNSED